MKKLLLLIAALMFSANMMAQDKPAEKAPEAEKSKFDLHPGVMMQAWSGYYNIGSDANEQIGFGVKRFRLYAKPTLTSNLSGFFQIEGAQSMTNLTVEDSMKTADFLSTFRLLHANLDYKINDQYTITVGKFIGAGMMGAGLLSSKNIDLIDRAEAAVTWAKETAGTDFADYGAEVTMKQKFGLTTKLWVHNGNVNKNVVSGKGSANKSVAVDLWASYKPAFAPAVEFGGSIGDGNHYVLDQFNYTGFLYISPAPFRFKAEYATVENYEVNRKFQGFYVMAAYAVTPNIEVLGMYDWVDRNTRVEKDEITNYSFGAAYYFFPKQKYQSKITAGYVIKTEDESAKIDNDMFVIEYQLDLSL